MSALGVKLVGILLPKLVDKLTEGKGDTIKEVADAALVMTGLRDDATVADIQAELANNPEAYIHLQRLATEQAIAEIEARTIATQLVASDLADARALQRDMDNPIVGRLALMAALFAGGAFLTVVGLIIWVPDIDRALLALLSAMAGNASARMDQVYNFFLGSSLGSKSKTDMMAGRS